MAVVEYIPGYVPLRMEGEPIVRIGKANNYAIRIPTMPKGVHVMKTILSRLQKLQYNDHDILTFPECTRDTYEERAQGDHGSIIREPVQWALGLQWFGLLSIDRS